MLLVERRNFRRYNLICAVRYYFDSHDLLSNFGYAYNISKKGVFVLTNYLCNIEDKLKFEMTMFDMENILRFHFKVKVIWAKNILQKKVQNNFNYKVGMQITNVLETNQYLDFIDKKLGSASQRQKELGEEVLPKIKKMLEA